MESICRLCGEEKKPNELTISINETIQIITFKELVEYHCRVSLDESKLDLPQLVCRQCLKIVVSFSEFSDKVDKRQQIFNLNKERAKRGAKENDSDFKEPEHKKAKTVEPVTANPKPIEKAKNESSILQETSQSSSNHCINDPKATPTTSTEKKETENSFGLKRQRRKSVLFMQSIETLLANDRSIGRNFEEVDKLFGLESARNTKNYERIEVPESKLLPAGEVPREWLEQFKDFKTWDDLKFNCENHCKENFDGINSYISHMERGRIPLKERNIKCELCDKVFTGPQILCSYINHMSRCHYDYIKFCCLVCSAVFYNIPHLSDHYQKNHPSRNFTMYPCLECGLYCQSLHHLKSHKNYHDVRDKKSLEN